MIKINAGCEYRPLKDSINIDLSSNSKADLIADLEKMPIRDNVIDEIYCWGVLEHVESPIRIMREFRRVIKDNCFLKLAVPNIHTLPRITWNIKAPLEYHSSDPSANVNGFDTIILNNLFRLTGFKSLKFEYFEDSYFWHKHKSIFRFIVPFIPMKLHFRGLSVIAKSLKCVDTKRFIL